MRRYYIALSLLLGSVVSMTALGGAELRCPAPSDLHVTSDGHFTVVDQQGVYWTTPAVDTDHVASKVFTGAVARLNMSDYCAAERPGHTGFPYTFMSCQYRITYTNGRSPEDTILYPPDNIICPDNDKHTWRTGGPDKTATCDSRETCLLYQYP